MTAAARSAHALPVVLCVDLEPNDRRAPPQSRGRPRGIDLMLERVSALRASLSDGAGSTAQLSWFLRIDPQIEMLFGTPWALATMYRRQLATLRDAGDEIGIHPHSWRWDGDWVSDQADAEWVSHCVEVGLDGFERVFEERCSLYRHGDRYMSTAIARQLDDAGVVVDLTVEPGLPATRGLVPDERTTGWIPDTTDVPAFAYRPSRDDFRAVDPQRTSGLLLMPLTPAQGQQTTLTLWQDPGEFAGSLRARLQQRALTHLAFAVRSDIALLDQAWEYLTANLAEVARQLPGRHTWCTPLEAALLIGRHRHRLPEPTGNVSMNYGERSTSSTITVSAVIPVHNSGDHLRAAVDSVLAQTKLPQRLIVIDDGSSDNAADFLYGLSAPLPIHLVRTPNRGQSAARNRAAALSGNELIAFLDQDDLWDPRHLEVLYEPFRTDARVGLSYSDFDEIDAEGHLVTRCYLREHNLRHPKATLAECLAGDLLVIPSASVFRRSLLIAAGGFDEQLIGYEDDDLYVRLFRSGVRMAFCDEALTSFRVHPHSSTSSAAFVQSRRVYADKLRATIPNDPRRNRYYVRDLVAPRFFAHSLDDYVRSVSYRDWDIARRSRDALNYYAALGRRPLRLRAKLAMIGSPRRFRMLLRVFERLPRRYRARHNPLLYLRERVADSVGRPVDHTPRPGVVSDGTGTVDIAELITS